MHTIGDGHGCAWQRRALSNRNLALQHPGNQRKQASTSLEQAFNMPWVRLK